MINETISIPYPSNYLDKNGGEFLKYAPVAMNAYQLSQLKKPENKQLPDDARSKEAIKEAAKAGTAK